VPADTNQGKEGTMIERPHHNSARAAVAIGALLFLLAATAGWFTSASAGYSDQPHTQLRTKLASTAHEDFNRALKSLESLGEQGTLDLWETALANPSAELRLRAWTKYRLLQPKLVRNELVPRIARIRAGAETIQSFANENGLALSIWSSSGDDTVAAASPRLLDRLRRAGISLDVVFDSISEWQSARAKGDALAVEITPDYQAALTSRSQVRIAVIDLSNQTLGSRRSEWLGDRENILMSTGSRVAYLDIFESDGSPESIDTHVRNEYTQRGFKLVGFLSPDEFATAVPQLFPGKSFDAGRSSTRATGGQFQATLAEGGYHSYEETRTEFRALADAHPDLAQYVSLGTSFEGREIFALKITRDPGLDDSGKPDALITGCHHAREWISVEAPVYFANQLVNRYSTDDQIKYLADHLQIWIVPIVNPDGLTYSQSVANDSFDPIRLWRKNRRTFNFNNCLSTVGVDLNRNYAYQWRLGDDSPCTDYCDGGRECFNDDIGASDDPRNDIYRGPSSASEPEVKALKKLMDDPDRHFRAQLDFHNYSQLILYPWGYQQFETPDASTLSTLAQRMSSDMRAVANRLYKPEQSIDLYATTGSSTDYAYGTNRVPAPFVIEMRPDCCNFTIPERDIPVVNRENWAGALAVLRWAAGPPILESVKAYSLSGGDFSKLVYSARWIQPADTSTGSRELAIDTRFPGIEPGPVQLRLQFSKPMDTSLKPVATLGRGTNTTELILTDVGPTEGWQKSVYQNDTWVCETIITQDQDVTSSWRLMVSASDAVGLLLDGRPESVASYATGTGQWLNYEDANSNEASGGADNEHVLPPTLRNDLLNIFLAKPAGGERLAAGDTCLVAWTIPKDSGFVAVRQDLLLSIDGGASFEPVASGLPGTVEKFPIVLPSVATTRARVRVLAIEGFLGNALVGDGLFDFTIGANVGSAVDIRFVSSEKVSQSWADPPSEDVPAGSSGSLRLVVNLEVTNHGSSTILNPFLRVDELTRGNVLLTHDPGSRSTAGALQKIEAGDNALAPGESVQIRLVLGLVKKKKFNLSVKLFGVPLSGSINPGSPVLVWSGKPKTR